MKTRSFYVVLSIICALTLGPATPVALGESPLLTNLSQAEMLLYGRESSGAIISRIGQMEKDLFGKEQDGTIMDRVAKLNAFVGASLLEGPSLAFKLAAVEWNLMRAVSSEPVVPKVDRLEKLITGNTKQGISIVARVEDLVNLCLPQGRVSMARVRIPSGTAVKIRMIEGFSSANAKKGDKIQYEVSRDVIVGTEVVIPKGTRGAATITSVEPAGRLGRDGKVELDFGSIRAIDGTRIMLGLSESVKKMNESLQLAVGASVAGFVIFGPIGALGGFLVEGKEAILPAGTEMFVSVQKEVEALGLTYPGDASGSISDLPVIQIKPGVSPAAPKGQ